MDNETQLIGIAHMHVHDETWRIAIDSFTTHAFLTLDLDGVIRSWSVGAERLFGYPADHIVGRHLSVLFVPADRDIGIPTQALQRAAQDGAVASNRRFVHRDGTLRYVRTTAGLYASGVRPGGLRRRGP